jgi:catechol 2,3-dioxygenase-like lactoylglutathione lyase family enzyme
MAPVWWGAQGDSSAGAAQGRKSVAAARLVRYGHGVACRISELVLGCRDPEVLARFWCEVLGFVVLDRQEDCIEIGSREGFGGPQPTIILSRRDEPEKGKPRLHIDVSATDRDQDAELERLLKLGARPADIGQTGEESWHVLADPEGNEFCLLKARLSPP